ncbi:MAG: hypothetical protein DME68_06970, partial [Verrucomicrobia bacterium]
LHGRFSERHRGDFGQRQRLAVQFHRGKLNVERSISNVQRSISILAMVTDRRYRKRKRPGRTRPGLFAQN